MPAFRLSPQNEALSTTSLFSRRLWAATTGLSDLAARVVPEIPGAIKEPEDTNPGAYFQPPFNQYPANTSGGTLNTTGVAVLVTLISIVVIIAIGILVIALRKNRKARDQAGEDGKGQNGKGQSRSVRLYQRGLAVDEISRSTAEQPEEPAPVYSPQTAPEYARVDEDTEQAKPPAY